MNFQAAIREGIRHAGYNVDVNSDAYLNANELGDGVTKLRELQKAAANGAQLPLDAEGYGNLIDVFESMIGPAEAAEAAGDPGVAYMDVLMYQLGLSGDELRLALDVERLFGAELNDGIASPPEARAGGHDALGTKLQSAILRAPLQNRSGSMLDQTLAPSGADSPSHMQSVGLQSFPVMRPTLDEITGAFKRVLGEDAVQTPEFKRLAQIVAVARDQLGGLSSQGLYAQAHAAFGELTQKLELHPDADGDDTKIADAMEVLEAELLSASPAAIMGVYQVMTPSELSSARTHLLQESGARDPAVRLIEALQKGGPARNAQLLGLMAQLTPHHRDALMTAAEGAFPKE